MRTSMCGKQYITSQNKDFAWSSENEPDSRASKGERWLPIEDMGDIILTFRLWYNYPVVSHQLLIIWREEAVAHWLITSLMQNSTSFRRIDRQNNFRVSPLRACDVLTISSLQSVPSLSMSEGRMAEWIAGITDKK